MRAIHWFRSDLRIADNTALADACRRADALAPVQRPPANSIHGWTCRLRRYC